MPKRRTIKIIFVITILLLVLIFVAREIVMYNNQRSEFENKTYDTLADFQTIEDVVRYMDCEFIRTEEPNTDSFDIDIYLKFKYDLYTDGASNQEYYYRAVVLFAQVTGYKNIRLIDPSKELVVAILGDTKLQEIVKLYINGKENYYGEQDTITALENYKETNMSRMEIKSSILKDLINNEWQASKVDFGTQESTLDGYDIYFDEGIEIKKVGKKVFNIVFTEKYADEIVNGIKVGTDSKEIENNLGKPAFGQNNSRVFGYKGEKIYIFFEKNRVSVYPVDQNEKEHELLTIIEEFRESRNVKKFVSAITDIWPDYDKYEYDADYVDLEYTLRGVKFQFNMGQNENGVIFYNNYNGSYIADLRQNKNNLPYYTYFKDENLVYKYEESMYYSVHNYEWFKSQYNYVKSQSIDHAMNNAKVVNKYLADSEKFFVLDSNKKSYIFAVNNDYVPIEIEEPVSNYFWLDNDNLAYGVNQKAIYILNATTQEKNTLIEGTDEFNIIDYKNGILYYDNKYLLYDLAKQGIDKYLQINDTTIIYSIKNQGIYLYNIATQEKNTIIEGNNPFELVKYENGRLFYDNTYVFYLLGQ